MKFSKQNIGGKKGSKNTDFLLHYLLDVPESFHINTLLYFEVNHLSVSAMH